MKNRKIRIYKAWRFAVRKQLGFMEIAGNQEIAFASFSATSPVLAAEWHRAIGTIFYKCNPITR